MSNNDKMREAFEIRYRGMLPPKDSSGEYMDHETQGNWLSYREGFMDALSQQSESEPIAWLVEGKALIGRSQKVVFNPAVAEEYAESGNSVTPLCKCNCQPAAQVPDVWERALKILQDQGLRDHDAVRDALAVLLAAPSIAEQRKWISCEESLPTENDADWADRVLGKSSFGEVEYWEWTDVESCEYDVTHWMPTGLSRPEPTEVE
jgi:hypothetical protein